MFMVLESNVYSSLITICAMMNIVIYSANLIRPNTLFTKSGP